MGQIPCFFLAWHDLVIGRDGGNTMRGGVGRLGWMRWGDVCTQGEETLRPARRNEDRGSLRAWVSKYIGGTEGGRVL